MKLSMNWLKDYVDRSFEPKEYCDKMTLTGSKVEGYEELGKEINNVVVGKLLSVEKHPDSDHLLICMVDGRQGRTDPDHHRRAERQARRTRSGRARPLHPARRRYP